MIGDAYNIAGYIYTSPKLDANSIQIQPKFQSNHSFLMKHQILQFWKPSYQYVACERFMKWLRYYLTVQMKCHADVMAVDCSISMEITHLELPG